MPIGIITNCLAVALGGLLGSVIKDRLPDSFKNNINMILGLTETNMETADVNGDGRVNVSDVPALINLILGV